ncbi:ABC-type dipeptide/oligopeptide/nickel transport system, permease component [Roseovarius mucosus DSM 17069]|uniref:ABC-type dipeptide/oligopeptide/nickel transport system, permease component n=1 Tax=Roseovarius mucosus DSM 17069 TaxID=1288298 RepID=A0A0A0HPK4_9RHOB|nr:ABC transporter permease [Roseovarius mucosus]KGM88861.1 ABC-type dipeptide/oligopeptide/nickel transport system, permease component [Roseovarius mucosus DSM 17069]
MFALIFKRLALGLVTIWLVSALIFLGVEALPGDACTAVLERDAHGEALEKCREIMGLNAPALTRYMSWAASALQGDFGISANGQESISELVGYRVRNSFLLAAGALSVGIPLSIFLGTVAGLRRDTWVDILFSTGAILAMTIPEFVAATILILVFAIWLGWVPAIVLTPADAQPLEFFPEFILAAVVLTMLMVAHIMRMMRSSVIDAMASDYVQMATLKGVPYWRIVFRHALPNALLPAINIIALTVAWLLGGVVVVEVVFNYPGLGRLLVDSISGRDLPVVQAITLIVAATYVAINLIADILSLALNPRLRSHHMRRG